MSFDNYYCDLEDDDCFAIIPYHSHETVGSASHVNANYCWSATDVYIYIDILVFSNKLIFRTFNIHNHIARGQYSQSGGIKTNYSYCTFNIENNIFNNSIIVGLYGINIIKINYSNIWKIKIYSEYLNKQPIINTPIANHCVESNLKKYSFEDYIINHPSTIHELNQLIKIKNKDIRISNSQFDIILLSPTTPNNIYEESHILLVDRKNIFNTVIYKLYHLCKDLREKNTKKEMHYATLEDKMAKMQTEMRIKDTYTEETEQIRIDILEYKEKCTSYVKSIEDLQKKCLTLEMANRELEKNAIANTHIEDISKELKLLCKSIDSMKQVSNSNF